MSEKQENDLSNFEMQLLEEYLAKQILEDFKKAKTTEDIWEFFAINPDAFISKDKALRQVWMHLNRLTNIAHMSGGIGKGLGGYGK